MLADPMSPEAVSQEINVLPMNFRADYVPVPGKPGEFKEVHKVDLVKKGSNGESTPWRVKAIKDDPTLWRYVEPYYDSWLKGQEEPVDGTPLDAVAFVPAGLVGHMKNLHIRTVEDLATVTDGDLERIGMGARGWREKAKSYLESKKDVGLVAAENEQLRLENENFRAELNELKAQVNALTDDKPKRGRPPKQ